MAGRRPSGRSAASGALALLLGWGAPACGPPLDRPAQGEVVPSEAGFDLVVPEGWECRPLRSGLRLIKRESVGRGFPILHVERLPPGAADLGATGRTFQHPIGPGEYRYSRWANPNGHGFRLDVVIRGTGASYSMRADLWDEGLTVDRDLFEELFWPIVATVRDRGAPARAPTSPAVAGGGTP